MAKSKSPATATGMAVKAAREDVEWREFCAAVANLKAARMLARYNDVAVQRAQFDLANVTASGIDLLRDQGRARLASASLHRDAYRHQWMRTVVAAGFVLLMF